MEGVGEPASPASTPVTLHIYDLTSGIMRRHKSAIFGEVVGGMWHTGVSVYGREYFFEGGITSVPSGRSRFGKPRGDYNRKLIVGYTDLLKPEFEKWVRLREKEKYGRLCYHLVMQNCNHFTSEAVQFLTGNEIPSEILRLPQLITSSALGRLFSSPVDRFFGGWQWMFLRQQWKYRQRLDDQWARYTNYTSTQSYPQYSTTSQMNFSSSQALRAMSFSAGGHTESGSSNDCPLDRRLRLVGSPPARIFLFGPGKEEEIDRIGKYLHEALQKHSAEAQEKHLPGVEKLIERLHRLRQNVRDTTLKNCVAPPGNAPLPKCPKFPACELEVLVFLLTPYIHLWNIVLGDKPTPKPVPSDKPKEDPVAKKRALSSKSHSELSEHYPGFFCFDKSNLKVKRKKINIKPETIFEERKSDIIMLLDVISKLCLDSSMAGLLIKDHVVWYQQSYVFDQEEGLEGRLRDLLWGDEGLVGSHSANFDSLPVALQILVIRCFCNVFGANPFLGRCTAVAMASGTDSRMIESLGLRTRNCLHNKKNTFLRLHAVSLLSNAITHLNKDLIKSYKTPYPTRRPMPVARTPSPCEEVASLGTTNTKSRQTASTLPTTSDDETSCEEEDSESSSSSTWSLQRPWVCFYFNLQYCYTLFVI